MSKVLVQLLLSMVVGVSTAIGFAPNAVKIRQEVKTSLHERVNIALPNIGGTTQLKTNTSVSLQTQVKSILTENVKVDTKAKTNLNAHVNSNGTSVLNNVNLSPNVSLNGSTTTNAQTNIGADAQTSANSSVNANVQTNASVHTPVVDLNLKNKIKTNIDLNSTLNLNLPLLP